MVDDADPDSGLDPQTEKLDAAAAEMRSSWELVVLRGTDLVTHRLPDRGRIVVGRTTEADIVIDDASISRRHLLIHLEPTPAVEDLGSSNGSSLAGRKLVAGERVVARAGDTLQLGKSTCVLFGPGVAAPAARRSGELVAPLESQPGLVIADPALRQLHQTVGRIARGQINVLILGETGVGKEIFAERLHALSARAAGPLVRLNCAAFTESLLESELFGHEKGAFTGAGEHKMGLLELASGGTAFLDEIAEMALPVQAKLLRALEERSIRRVGGLKPIPIDVRFVAATNRDPESEIVAGRLRQDLYFRLNGFSFTVPPLRERPVELDQLINVFLGAACRQLEISPPPRVSDEALVHLRAYRWPGNIRELRNVVERALLLSAGQIILPEHLPLERMAPREGPPPAMDAAKPVAETTTERERVVAALAAAHGNQSRAALILGISRRTLVSKIVKFGLPRPQKL